MGENILSSLRNALDAREASHCEWRVQATDALCPIFRGSAAKARPRRGVGAKNRPHWPQLSQVAQMNPLCTAQQTKPGAHV